jgi:DNA polymerase-3 subunit gamma/tau
MQILGEARSRMSGVNYARVLAELALVRISLLEDLESLSTLVAQLKSGKFSGGGASAASRLAPAEGGRPLQRPAAFQRPSPPDEKKNDVREGEEPSSPAEVTVESSPPVAFEPGNESAVWSKVLGRLTDMTHTHAKNISRAAITGPNSLVLAFSKRYHLSKTHFERSDQLSRLEKLVTGVVGRPIRISLVMEDQAEQPVPTPKSSASSPARDPKTSSDPFVQQALAVFGASIIKQEKIVPPPGK